MTNRAGSRAPLLAASDADGGYRLPSLAPGRYLVEFAAGCGTPGYAAQWWHDASSAATATIVRVPASATSSGIDATLSTS